MENQRNMQDYQQSYEGKTILVTGGAGAIGSNLTRTLAGLSPASVIVLDDLSAASHWNIPSLPNVLFVRGSVTDEVSLKRVFALKPQVVFHLAAFFATSTAYFALGSIPEVQKLLEEFGNAYHHYQRNVPRLIPRPGRAYRPEARPNKARSLHKAERKPPT